MRKSLMVVVAMLVVLGASARADRKIFDGWILTTQTDRFDGDTSVYMSTSGADGGVTIVCSDDGVALFLHAKASIAGQLLTVKFRADEGPIETMLGVGLSDDLVKVQSSLKFIGTMVDAKSFAFRVLGKSNQVDVERDTRGARDAFLAFLHECRAVLAKVK